MGGGPIAEFKAPLARFGLVEPGEQWDKSLGIEPLSKGFTPEGFIGMLSGRTTPIKALLLDQQRIAGIGNIYACEALWDAGIKPGRPAKALTKPAVRRLHRAIIEVLARVVPREADSAHPLVRQALGQRDGAVEREGDLGRDVRPDRV